MASVNLLTSILTLVTSIALSGCGGIKVGGSTLAQNDPLPAGTIVAQGSFNGANGQSVTGTAVIYKSSSSGENIVRIENITVPAESPLQLQVRANGAILVQRNLKANSGNQNYSTGNTGVLTWNTVTIRSASQDLDYGVATLDKVSP